MALKPTYNNPLQTKPSGPYYGIDGWLRLIQFHMLLYILMLISNIVKSVNALPASIYPELNIADIIIAVFQISLIIVSFILMVNKLMLFRVFYTILLSTFIAVALLQILGGDTAIGIYNLIVCVAWIVYLYKSERVKNTFRKLGQAKTEYELSLEKRRQEAQQQKESANTAEQEQMQPGNADC